ncbi:7TM diverse intracellular signaling domain-containing protein [Ekhidna sp.]
MIKAFLYLFLIQSIGSSNGDHLYLDGDRDEFLRPINTLDILIDSIGVLTFDDVLSRSEKFEVHDQFKPKDYCVTCTYWVKLTLEIPVKSEGQWMIEFYDQTIDSITAYIPKVSDGYQKDEAGDYFPFGEKSFAHKNFEWLINSDIKGKQEVYFRVKSHSYADIRLAVRTVNRFVYYSLNEYFLYGIFYGMIFIVSIYNLLIFSAIRERKYLYYTFYIASVFVYAMCVDGIAYQYLWPNLPGWNQIAYGTALFSLIFWSLLFTRRFLNTKVRSPRLHKILTWTIIIRTVIFVIALLFDHELFEYRNIELIPMTLIFYSSIRVWYKGYKPARFFVLAYGMLFLGFLIKALLFLSIIPFIILSYYSLHVCFLLEMLFLTFALSDRVRILKDNRDRALKRSIAQHKENAELKDKVNRELEEKIGERTKQLEEKNMELAETNQQLFQQTEAINKINSKLDLDNWKLKNNIKEVLQDRLINKNLTYEQFNEIFPSELTCLNFLDKLKWGNGFHCIKCENKKFSKGHHTFSKRCTKCGYDESITSNTIFHRVKFPLEKAFYILYIMSHDANEYTLDELSEMLNLRRNTIWNFKKKIAEKYQDEESKFQVKNIFSLHLDTSDYQK